MNKAKSEPEPGIAARWATDCPRCPHAIHPGDRIVFNRGRAIHVSCSNGGDDA